MESYEGSGNYGNSGFNGDYETGLGFCPSGTTKSLRWTADVACVFALLINLTSLIIIPCHRSLRKQRFIFPFNLLLGDFAGIVVFATIHVDSQLSELILPEFSNVSGIVAVQQQVASYTPLMVSNISIIMVAVYQFITIRVDPFGVRGIITTPRCILGCLTSWVFSWGLNFSYLFFVEERGSSLLLGGSIITTACTGTCYSLVYRSIAGVPASGAMSDERRAENLQVMRTYGLIFGTSVLCNSVLWANWFVMNKKTRSPTEDCLHFTANVFLGFNWIANSLVYWWRLKEFRSMLPRIWKRRQRTAPVVA